MRDVLHQVIKANPIGDSRVAVTFENGVSGTYDCAYLMEGPYWARLKMPSYFRQVKAACGTLVWPGDLDVAPESVWERCAKEQYIVASAPVGRGDPIAPKGGLK